MCYTVTIDHIDTCLSCYLTDHHSRPGEVLIGVPVDGSTSRGAVMDELHTAWDRVELNEDMDVDVIEAVEGAFITAYAAFRQEVIGPRAEHAHEPFAAGLGIEEGREPGPDGEDAQAWFLVRYTEDDPAEDEADTAVALARLAELSTDPSGTISGEELIARLDAWIGTGLPDRYYFGFVDPAGLRVVTVQPKDVFFGPDLPMRLDLRNHSPSGFGWGYEGSGPAQLALAILCDAVGATRALPIYQRFKDAVVATWPQEGTWSMTHGEVLAHVVVMEAASRGEGA